MAKTGDDWREPPPAPPGEAVGVRALIAAVRDLAGQVGTLVDKITANDNSRRWIIGLLAANLVALLAIGLAGAVFVSRLTGIADSNQDNGRILIECTTPGDPKAPDADDHVHECYDRSLANQAAAVGRIVDTNHNGIADTVEILANQEAIARRLGIPLTPSTTVPPG